MPDQLRRDSDAAEARLGTEDASLADADTGHVVRAEAAETAVADAAEAVRLAEAEANRATEAAAEANARAQAVAQQLIQAEQRWRRLEDQFARIREERDRIGAQAIDPAALHAAGSEQSAAETALAAVREALAAAEHGRAATGAALTAARDRQSAAELGSGPTGSRGARPSGGAGGQGRRALAADGRCAECSVRTGSRTRRGAGRGTDIRRGPRRRAPLARIAAVRAVPRAAGRSDATFRAGPGSVGACPGAVADRSGGR